MFKLASKFFVMAVLLFSFSAMFAAEIHCNPDTKTCHKSTCRYYNCKGCTKVFQSEDEVTKNGYKFCKICSEEKTEKKGKK
ncbi:MAG TPA: hypothetical protein PLD55_03340 [bacterium]|jgi:hypothetical protein|nr:hypothetical protein [bacterium]MDX9806622.1 hypothetical protein [bacterium]HNW15261.1 hypothetical protein [bacterium]HNZ52596.1 hypothetical protein [bacterium]HOB70885.1 hypothetical protein [bacterium]